VTERRILAIEEIVRRDLVPVFELDRDPVPPNLRVAWPRLVPVRAVRAEFVIVPARPVDGHGTAVDGDGARHRRARREVIEHVFAIETTHDAVVAVANHRLLQRETKVTGDATFAVQPDLVGAIRPLDEGVAVVVEGEDLQSDRGFGRHHPIRQRDTPAFEHFAHRASHARIPDALAAGQIVEPDAR
jgi:hypothetical protein